MAAIIVNQGLQMIGDRASAVTGAGSALQCMVVDDTNGSFGAGSTTLNTPTNFTAINFDSTPTRSSQTVTHITTYPAGSANFTIRRVSLHNFPAANVGNTSASLCAGVDGQSITKTSDFSLAITMKITYTSA